LELGEDAGACSDFPTGWPGLAVPPGTAHSPWGVINKMECSDSLSPLFSAGSYINILIGQSK